jgi:hypothetical protein
MSTTSTGQAALGPGRAPGVVTEPEPVTVRSGWDTSVRHPVVPPDLQDCAPAGTPVHDDDPRMLYHASLGMVATPDVEHGLKTARRLLRVNRQSVHARVHAAVDGERGTGKTALTHLIGRAHQGRIEQLHGTDANRIPVVCVNAPPSRDDAVNWSAQLAVFLGWDLYRRDVDGRSVLRMKDWTGPAVHVMRASRTRLVLVDGVDRLRNNDIQPTFDFFDFLAAEIPLTVIWCGTGAREILHEARGERGPALPRPAGTRHTPAPRNSVPVLWVNPPPLHRGMGKDPERLRRETAPAPPQEAGPARTRSAPAPLERRAHGTPRAPDLPGRPDRHRGRRRSHHRGRPPRSRGVPRHVTAPLGSVTAVLHRQAFP